MSSPKDGAVFWSGTAYQAKTTGQPDAARVLAKELEGVTLESTPGGRIIDGWDEINDDYPWDELKGPAPWASDVWGKVSTNYAKSASGEVNVVQTPKKLRDKETIWYKREKGELIKRMATSEVSNIKIHVLDSAGKVTPLPDDEVTELLMFK